MRWTVEGADAGSGQERVMTIEAETKAEAEQIARSQGLLVSDVHQPVSLSADEQLKAMANEGLAVVIDSPPNEVSNSIPPRARNRIVPEYIGIVRGAKLLKSVARGYKTAGVILAALAAVVPIAAVIAPGDRWPAAIVSSLVLVTVSVLLFQRATMIRLQSELALATRDIARNSFR